MCKVSARSHQIFPECYDLVDVFYEAIVVCVIVVVWLVKPPVALSARVLSHWGSVCVSYCVAYLLPSQLKCISGISVGYAPHLSQ